MNQLFSYKPVHKFSLERQDNDNLGKDLVTKKLHFQVSKLGTSFSHSVKKTMFTFHHVLK